MESEVVSGADLKLMLIRPANSGLSGLGYSLSRALVVHIASMVRVESCSSSSCTTMKGSSEVSMLPDHKVSSVLDGEVSLDVS